MIGSTFIFEEDVNKLKQLEIDRLDRFEHVDLDVLLTLDFELVCRSANVQWTAEPLIYQEEAGMALFLVTEAGLQQVLNSSTWDREQINDIEKLRAFTNQHGLLNIYELATF